MRTSRLAITSILLLGSALATEACVDDSTSSSSAAVTNTVSVVASGSSGSGMGAGGKGSGGMGAGGKGSGGMGAGGKGSGGSPPVTLNGCTLASASDKTGLAQVVITDIEPWNFSMGHHVCIVVDTGTTVVWNGVNAGHPLSGGETPVEDPYSIISTTDPVSGSTTIQFSQAGTFPYFCTLHTTAMEGVVYVQ